MKPPVYLPLFLVLTACNSFLDADLNKSQITTDKVFSNDVTATAAVTAIYNTISANSALSGMPTGMNALAGLSAGELYNYPQNPDLIAFQQHQINSQNPNVERLWNCLYNIIYQANAVLEGVDGSPSLSRETTLQLRGEALFIRAFSYFYLVNLFGDVPMVVEADYRKNQHLSRRPVDDIYVLMESDLLTAQSLLSQEYVTDSRARPNKATATALLARLYLYRKQYARAEAEASSIIGDPSYRLTAKDNIDKTFLIDSPEIIWQLMPVTPYANTVEGLNFIVVTTPHNHVVTTGLLDHFEVGDLRAAHWVSSYTNALGTFYFPYKYKLNTKAPSAPFTECSVVFRLAEMHLIRAEARARLANVPGAQADLNIIRARAGLPDTAAGEQPELLQTIEAERWSELFTEYGHRWLDLKRTGRAVEILANGITSDDLLYPLPAAEFIKNSNLGKQNQGY